MQDEIDLEKFEDSMPDLLKGILRRAISDYRIALKRKRKRAIERLEKFFYSDYCETILDFIELDKDVFFEKLSRMEKQYT